MKVDYFSARKRFLTIGQASVAYYEEGNGEPLLLLHGCPFSSYIWRKVIPCLAPGYRCLAPDLLGLGDTETPEHADWSLRAQAAMIVGFLVTLGVNRAHVVGHDHGGALAQLLAAEHPDLIERLVIMNAEAYDNWPSEEERPLIRLIQTPVVGDLALWLWSRRPVLRLTLSEGKAVHNPEVLTTELLDGYIRANLSDRHRRQKTKRFVAGQFDPAHNRVTTELLDGLRRFRRPTLLIWATEDPHFGPTWGERLKGDIPGAVRLELVPDTGHLLMEERPELVADLISSFLAEPLAEPNGGRLARWWRMAPMPDERVSVIPLDRVGAGDAGQVGSKAANLGELKKAGMPVPDGFVVVGEPGEDLAPAVSALGDGPVAVRSSALAEDLAEASFADQYETVLNVRGPEQIREAIRRCRSSASSERVASYRAGRAEEAGDEMAVLVQRMVAADAAGVTFTANPVTGDRDELVISAVRGMGERLVFGEVSADEWVVRSGRPLRRRSGEDAIRPEQATAVAELARRAAEHFGRPQDVEWAFAGGELFLLQSRPMTALPAPLDWKPPDVRGLHPPGPSYWIRNLRLGEWLPEPVTPLFEDWLLRLINSGFARGARADSGMSAGLRHAIVNGWYYSTPEPDLRAGALLRGILTRPLTMFRFATAIIKQPTHPEIAEAAFSDAWSGAGTRRRCPATVRSSPSALLAWSRPHWPRSRPSSTRRARPPARRSGP